jgi:CheY-like chemotaxis protein
MRVKVLILEDIPLIRRGLSQVIWAIRPEKMERLGIEDFDVDSVDCAAAAYEALEKAIRDGEPYDVLILDLRIPLGKVGKSDSPNDIREDLLWVANTVNGMDVLRYVKKTGSVKEVIVYSAYYHYDNVANAFRLGVVDFIAKVDEKKMNEAESLEQAVLAAWERVLARENAQTLEKRFQALVPYAEQVLTYQFGISFSRLVGSISRETEAMKIGIADRLGLDAEKDTHDPLLWHLVMVQKLVDDARKDWDTLPQMSSSDAESDELKEVVVEDELKKIVGDVLHSLTLKHMETKIPADGNTRVLSFAVDVPTILREIIVGSLGEVREKEELILGEEGHAVGSNGDQDWNIKMDINVRVEGPQAEIRFEDNLQPIEGDVAERINKGLDVATDGGFGRVWGLSIAQHACRRGAARIFVEPLAEGNRISYFVPIKY